MSQTEQALAQEAAEAGDLDGGVGAEPDPCAVTSDGALVLDTDAASEEALATQTHWEQLAGERAVRIAALEATLCEIYGGWSWRLTRPVRLIGRVVRGARRRMASWVLGQIRGRTPYEMKVRVRAWLSHTPVRLPPPTPPKSLQPFQTSPVLAQGTTRASAPVDQVPLPLGAPLVTVVIPCFNYGAFVVEAVESVLRQTLASVEVLVVDDGSTDAATRHVLETLDGPRTRVIRQANRGLGGARNRGIQEAQGRYVCCLDADDRLAPTYLEKAVALLEADHGVSFVYPWAQLFDGEDSVWCTEPFNLEELRARNYIAVAGVFRRRDWEAVGGYAEDMPHMGYEDWEFWLRLGEAGRRGVLIPEALFEYRRRPGSMVEHAQARHKTLVSDIRHRHAALYGDSAHVQALAEGYEIVPTVPPFANLEPALRPRGAGRHLLAVVPWLLAGGAETVLHAVLQGVRRHDPELVITIVTTEPAHHEWHKRFAELTDEIYHLPAFLPRELWGEFIELVIRTRATGTLLCSGSRVLYEMLPRLKQQFPELVAVDVLHNAAPEGHLQSVIGCAPFLDLCVAVSPQIQQALEAHGVPPERVRVILNGVDTAGALDPRRANRAAARQEWRVSPEAPVVTFLGRMSAEKQPLEFLAMIRALRDGGAVAQYLMVGDGPQRETVERYIADHHLEALVRRVTHVPPSEVAPLLSASDILAITSSVEGLPMVLLEALAMGVPVVAYDVGGIHTVLQDGRNGRLISAGHRRAFVRALGELIGRPDERERLARGARPSLIERGLTLEAMQRAYADVLFRGARAASMLQ